jgi:hypothetical protein
MELQNLISTIEKNLSVPFESVYWYMITLMNSTSRCQTASPCISYTKI